MPRLRFRKRLILSHSSFSRWNVRTRNARRFINASTDESDYENRYEMEGKERRKLTVANAEVVASSKAPRSAKAQEKIGLGLVFTQEDVRGRGFQLREEDAYNRLHVSHQVDPDIEEHGRLSLASYPSAGSIYTDDEESEISSENTGSGNGDGYHDGSVDLGETHNRRKAALLGLVRGLDDLSLQSDPSTHRGISILSEGESDYCGEKGLAVSGSLDLGAGSGLKDSQRRDFSGRSESEYGFEVDDGSGARVATPPTVFGYHYAEDEVDGTFNQCPPSKSSKRYPLHPASSLSPTTLYDYPPTSPRLPMSMEKDRKSVGDIVRSDRGKGGDASKRKSFTRNLSPTTPAISTLKPLAPSLPLSSSSPATPAEIRHTGSAVKRESHNTYEAVVLAKRSKEAAVRSRQAFGIPSSESEEIYHPSASTGEPTRFGRQTVDLSEPRSSLLSTLPPVDSMASGMERAIESLSCDGDNELSIGAENLFKTLSLHEGESGGDQERTSSVPEAGQETLISPALMLDNLLGVRWSLLESYGGMEIQRQEVIYDLRLAEASFVEHLSSIVHLFILPLRVQASKTWISGVPLEIAKLLDWLEDIMNLHAQIRDTLRSFQTPARPFAGVENRGGVIQALRTFVPKLEIYQPYLVKIAGVLEMLQRLVKDDESDFGEFVRIQEKTRECSTSLSSMLSGTVNKLATYPDSFRRLLDLTPKFHEEYLDTLMLVHSTTFVVKTLMAVKTREEEYEFIKNISGRIDGIPSSTNLVRRERRLLCYGQLLHGDLRQCPPTDNSDRDSKSLNPLNRLNRLVDAVNEWDSRRSRSDSVKSNNSASTGVSFRSVATSSPPPPPQLLALVFSDLVVFATPRFPLRESTSLGGQEQQGSERWTVCEDIGISRVLEVKREDSYTSDERDDGSDLKQNISSSSLSGIRTIQFKVPTTSSNPSRESWLSAFQRSSQSTLRILSNPSFSHSGGNFDRPNQLLEKDRRRILESILETGLPFPKSPSLQLADESASIETNDATQMEREERGWWSLQFQQLLMEKKDSPDPYQHPQLQGCTSQPLATENNIRCHCVTVRAFPGTLGGQSTAARKQKRDRESDEKRERKGQGKIYPSNESIAGVSSSSCFGNVDTLRVNGWLYTVILPCKSRNRSCPTVVHTGAYTTVAVLDMGICNLHKLAPVLAQSLLKSLGTGLELYVRSCSPYASPPRLKIFAKNCFHVAVLYVRLFDYSASADTVGYIPQLNYLPLAQILCASSLHGTNPPFYISALNHGCEILALLLPIKPTSADTADRIPQGSKFTLKGAVLCAQPALRLAG
ncbi:hypothetical protein BDP27DRAFT_1400887 [Rhodocollybia butyracea]|uniref:DH domain-containing protein n=1 Tax=Rhodocollybia butyracea TaxID=206335 RepID=A0A9P5PZX3_9AGAR|nr:hypothetical protein BDP27DRAFT_1400887 [Rhodocollybia butyracea]